METIMEAVVADAGGAKRTFEAVRRSSGRIVWRDAVSGAAIQASGAGVPEAICAAVTLWKDQGLHFRSITWVAPPSAERRRVLP